MESTTTKPKTAPNTAEGTAGFIPVPLEKMKVGHAGLYVDDEPSMNENTKPIAADIALDSMGDKMLIVCETGIGDEVRKLAKDKSNHLPNSITGIFIHYLTEGLIKDFNRTWDETPYCLREKKSPLEKSKEKGKRVLSKKEKNELLAKTTWSYWEPDVNEKKITREEAISLMLEAVDKKKEYEDAGYFLSPNKTQGVALFDWKSEIAKKWDDDTSKLKIYTRHSIIPLVPCFEDKMNLYVNNKFVRKEVDKSILNGMSVATAVEFIEKKIPDWKKLKENYEVKTIHIAKINQSGKMKDRWFVVDAIRKADKKQVLLMWDKNGVDGMLE